MRIAMFFRTGFGHNWADAAGKVADVIRIETVSELDRPHVDGFPNLALIDVTKKHYHLRAPRDLPRRLFGRYADLPSARRHAAALRFLRDRHGPIDVLHAHFYPQARSYPFVSKQLGIPYVVTEHSTALTRQSPDKTITRVGVRSARRTYRSAALVMPVSHALLESIRELDLHGRFEVIPNPIDTSLFAPPMSDDPSETVDLISVGRLDRVKGHDVLIRAFGRARRGDTRLRLTIVGSGPREAELQTLCSNEHLSDFVRFVPYRSSADLAVRLQAADAFVLASRIENLSIAIIEAVCTGLPAIVTDVGGNPEIVTSDLGELVPVEDSDALARAITDIVRRLKTVDRAERARTAAARYAIDVVGARLGDAYQMVCSSTERASATSR